MISFKRLTILYAIWVIVLVLLAAHSLVYGQTAMMHSFNRGILTPKLASRSDVKIHYAGCRELSNMVCQVYGGASKRPGTYYIAEVADSGKAARVIPYSRATEAGNYVLEFGDKTIRFYLGD